MIFTHPSIDPIIFSLGFIDIRWYSLAYISTFLIGLFLIKFFNNQNNSKISNKHIEDFLIWSILGVIIGGRLGYVLFYQFEIFINNPFYLIYIWQGGMSFHGGLIGMTFSIFLFSKKNSISFYYLADLVSLVAPIGLFLGRIANYINIELIGRVTEFPLAIRYPTIDNLTRHPSQLYEALLEGIILFIILLFIFFYLSSKKKDGYLSSIFLIFYSIFRFAIEFLREPDDHIGLIYEFFTLGQILCIPIILFGIILFIKKNSNA